MKKLAFLLSMLVGYGAAAQTIEDLELLNTTGLHGTPRYQSMGGAFTALGNDFSSIHLNPAGASVFRRDQFGLSLGFQGQRDRTRFLESSNENSNFNLLFENIGLVKKFGNNVPLTFAVSYNKMADFNSDFNITGTNVYQPTNNGEIGLTLGEYWLAGAQDLSIEELESRGWFEEASAASAELLPLDSVGNPYLPYSPLNSSDVSYSFSQQGSRSEAAFSLGSQIEDKLFFGFGVGIPNLSYQNNTRLTESGFADTSFIRQYSLNRSTEVYATGFNIKLGAIAKPAQWLRVAASYQSPSWYRVSEVYVMDVEATANNGERFLGTQYVFDDIRYATTTPSILRGGAAVILAKQAVFSLDYEHTNAGNLSLRSRDGNNYESYEADYQEAATASHTVKAGFEYRIGPTFARLGYQLRQSNFANPDEYYSDRSMYSIGFGYASRNFGIDIGYVMTEFTNNYVAHPYLGDQLDGGGISLRERTLVSDQITKGNFVIGLDFRF